MIKQKINEADVKVIKTDGRIEEFNPDKIYKYAKYSTEGTDISPSDLMMNLNIHLQKRMQSSDIQDSLIKAAADKISIETPHYAIVAARLLNQKLRKMVYNSYIPDDFTDSVVDRVKRKMYDEKILENYNTEELQELGNYIKYDRDNLFKYLGMLQLSKKYLVRNKNNEPIETPQEALMLIPTYIFMNSKNRKKYITEFYDDLSTHKIVLSSPIASGVRTRLRMYSSCAGIMVPDTSEGIAESFNDIYLLTLNRAGIGANYGHIRGEGADIDNGREKHTGITPINKVAEKISLSAMQPGTGRGGAITQYYPFFHYEIEHILELKNNKGTDDNRIRQSDHAIIFNDFFYKRLRNKENITLFYMNDIGNLYERIGFDNFEELYTELENKRGIKKRSIPAEEIYKKFWIERIATGRYFKVNATEFQFHSAFKVPVYNSNLCTEISIPSFMAGDFVVPVKKGYKSAMESLFKELQQSGEWYYLYEYFWYNKDLPQKGTSENFDEYRSMLAKPRHIRSNDYDEVVFNFKEIFVCILLGLNLGAFKTLEEIERTARISVRFLDELIDYQDYPIEAMKTGATKRRALGISISGLFHYLAQRNLDYSTVQARNEIHKVMEALYYGAITESIQIAKEKGPCYFYNDTKYSDGLLTIDTYNKNVDELVTVDYQYDWDKVRADLKKYGIRNSTLLTMVPASNSARLVNTISGIEPPQDLVTTVEDKKMIANFLLPEVDKYKDFYEKYNVWNIDTSKYYKLIAVMQKFIDQAISLNQYNSYLKYKDEKIPFSVLVEQDTTAIKYGLKTMYYSKTQSDNEGKNHIDQKSSCSGGGCEI